MFCHKSQVGGGFITGSASARQRNWIPHIALVLILKSNWLEWCEESWLGLDHFNEVIQGGDKLKCLGEGMNGSKKTDSE